MASVEASSSTHGPRYAPDDPTLPQPWKGLIDGSTGVLYYWNPETNVTQYEKPTALPPPLPPGPPPAAPTPKLNPIPSTRTVQSDGFQNPRHTPALMPQGQLISSSSQQHIQLTPQVSQHQVPPPDQVQGSHLGPGIQQQGHLAPEQIRTQIVEQPGQQVSSLLGQMPTHPGQLGISQPTPHIPNQPGSQASYLQMQQIPHGPQGQMYSNSQMGNPHGFQFNPHQASYAVHQQNMPPQGPQSLQPSQHLIPGSQLPHQQDQVTGLASRDDSNFLHGKHSGFSAVHQHMMQGQQFPHPREQKNGIPQIDDVEYQQGKKAGFSPAQVQQTGTPSMQNLSAVASSTQASNMSTMPNQTTLYGGGSSVNMQQTNPSLQLHQAGTDLAHSLHGSRFPNQMDPGMMHSQQQNLPPVASKMAYEENHIGRTGNDFNHSTNKGAPAMHQLPKLAPLPMARNQQEMRMGDFPQNVTPIVPGRLNGPGPSGGPALHGVYGHTSGAPPFPNTAFPSPPSAMMGSTDPIHLSAVEVYRQKHEVTATGEDVPAPFMTFEATGFPPEILQEMHFAGFSAPTPIQAQTWPIALLNKDIVAIAKTGSGKTLGYLIPAFIHLRRRQNNPQNGPTVLVLSPTRELATQIQDEALKFGRSSRVSCTCLYGGAPKGLQLKELDRGVDIVVATPGRLNDILEMKRINFRQISFLVLDEADRMLDMGFEPQIRKIVNEIPPRRQTLMYTATWPKEVRKIASDLLVNPVQVNIGSVDELSANKAITQHVEVVPEMEKQRRLEQILMKKVVLEDTAHDYDDYHNIEKLLVSTEMVPKIILVDCYSSETPAEHFLNKRGWVHYNELISYWIIEGHLGHFSCIEDAYAQGHHVLMELLDCGLLKTLKAGYVKSNGARFEFSAQDYFDLYQNNRLGLATTFENKLGNTVLGDGLIRTFPRDKEREKKEEKMSTLLLDGDRTGEVSDNLFDSMIDLKILAIFNPTHKPFPLPISYMSKYRLLVLRGCEFLESFDKVFKMIGPEDPKTFSHLTVLEISGPSSLKKIPENLFDTMTNLKSLNMSSLQMEFLPPSFYDLKTIEILILKDCSSLKIMESLKKFERLQLLDLSGATSLEAFKDKSFSKNRKLQMINLSQSRIAKFPVVHSLENLQYLSLSKCPALVRVRKIGSVKTLRVFDISGSKKVEQLLDPGLKNLENLFTLDVSGTAISRLPSTIGTPRYLHLRDCSNLKQLPPIETLSEVRVLDLSGSALLDDVKKDFITSLKNLAEFNLSKTGVVQLSYLSSLVNLRRLLMSQCQRLQKLEGLGSLKNLEVLDLSGCKALSKLEDQSFDKMVRLHSLDLSETPLDTLPSLSNLEKLKRLNLRGCTKLRNIPGFEDLPVLEDLDISRTTLKVPKFENLDCRHGPKPSSFKIFKATEILEDLGAQPLSNCDDTKKLPQEKMDQCDHWNISNSLASQNSETIGKPVIDAHFLQLLEMHSTLLEDNIKKFNFFVYPMEEATEQPIDKKLPIKEFVLRKILLGNVIPKAWEEAQDRCFWEDAQHRCLEIRGFRDFPKFLEQLLEQAEMMVLIKNSCIQFLSDLGAGNLKKMKVCWIERCNEMEYVTDEVKESADIPTENIKILWVSEAAKLKSICKETSRGIRFSALTSLYLEYCPELSSLSFSNEQLSGLKILHVKYCQKLEKLFEAQFPNLESLYLWALPALKKISCGMQSLNTLTVAHCPLLLYIFDGDTSSPTNLKGLQLKVKFCDDMESIFQDGKLPSGLLRENIIILGCPKLHLPESSAPRNT